MANKIFLLLIAAVWLKASSPVLAAEKSPYKKYYDRKYSNKGLLAEEKEIQVGAAMHQKLTEQMRFITDPVVVAYANQIGQRLAQQSVRPNLTYHFFVIEDQTINAFATMGGYVYVNSGLLLQLTNEAQLAAVMAHEIGHIAARHGLRQVKVAKKWQILSNVVGAVSPFPNPLYGALSSMAAQLVVKGEVMKHSRDSEDEADYLGLVNIRNAGYTTRGMVEMLQTLQELSGNRASKMGVIMASHPPPKDRVEKSSKEIQLHLVGSDQQGMLGKAGIEFVKLRDRANGIIPPPDPPQAEKPKTAKKITSRKRRKK